MEFFMEASKLQLKIFAEPAAGVTPETFIPVFHGWIKHHRLPELMVDVANYGHVPKGPGVVLIGHSCDYFIDEAEGRFGLLHSRKRMAPPPAERLADAFRRTLHAASLLAGDPALAGKLRFRTGELLFRINDRLAAPNDDRTFAALEPELGALCAKLFAAPFELVRVGDAKGLFAVKIVTRAEAELATLLERLGGAPGPDRSLERAPAQPPASA
jgi:hypothetical protein